MDEHEWLAERFEEHRAHMQAVAYRMLGSRSEADDALQLAWLPLSGSDTSGVENLGGWLTTVVAPVCLNILRSRQSRREDPLDPHVPEPTGGDGGVDPEQEAMLADSFGLALLTVLDMLTPAERVAFVLHDMFDVPFDEIAPILARFPDAARQLASRARRLVHGRVPAGDGDLSRQREVVNAFLAASRGGDFAGLIAVLDPTVVLRADHAAVGMGASREARGAAAVAETFSGRARAARPALVNGAPGLVWASGGRPLVVFAFTIAGGKVVEVDLIADPERLRQLDLAILDE